MAKKSSGRLIIILVAVVVVTIIIAVVGKKQGWFGQPEGEEVTVAAVAQVDIVETVSASGKVQPEVEVKISPDVSGEIVELHVQEGQYVEAGTLLLKIRPDNYVSILDRVRANLNTNQAQQAQAQARAAQSEAQLVQARASYERNQQLFKEKVISEADWEQAQAQFTVAQKEATAAQETVRAARFNVQSARAAVDEAQENLRRTSILAPMSGTISKLAVELGERVVGTSQMAGTEMLRIANLTQMEVRVDVNENDIIRVEVGDTAEIDVDSYAYRDKKFRGVVTAIANTANETLTPDAVTEFEVRVRILNDSYSDLTSQMEQRTSPFRPGMTASVEVVTDRKRGVVSVPLAAVTTRVPGEKRRANPNNEDDPNVGPVAPKADPVEVVFVVEAGKVLQRPVRIGISDFENIEILSGLKAGETVVAGPFRTVSQKLEDGNVVNVKEEKDDKKPDGATEE